MKPIRLQNILPVAALSAVAASAVIAAIDVVGAQAPSLLRGEILLGVFVAAFCLLILGLSYGDSYRLEAVHSRRTRRHLQTAAAAFRGRVVLPISTVQRSGRLPAPAGCAAVAR